MGMWDDVIDEMRVGEQSKVLPENMSRVRLRLSALTQSHPPLSLDTAVCTSAHIADERRASITVNTHTPFVEPRSAAHAPQQPRPDRELTEMRRSR